MMAGSEEMRPLHKTHAPSGCLRVAQFTCICDYGITAPHVVFFPFTPKSSLAKRVLK